MSEMESYPNVLDCPTDHVETDWPTVPTTELLDRLFTNHSTAHVIQFHGISRYDGSTGTVTTDYDTATAPCGADFDTVHLSDALAPSDSLRAIKALLAGEHDSATSALYLPIPSTGWSDYSGSTTDRANYVALHRDFPTTFVDVSGDYCYSGLAVRLDGTRITELLADSLTAMVMEYPLYDDESHSELQEAMATEQWADHGLHDFKRQLERRLQDMLWWNPDTDPEAWTWWPTDDELSTWFWDFDARQRPYDPFTCETAVSVHFGTIDDDVDRIIPDIVRAALERKRLTRPAAPQTDATPEA